MIHPILARNDSNWNGKAPVGVGCATQVVARLSRDEFVGRDGEFGIAVGAQFVQVHILALAFSGFFVESYKEVS